MLVSGRFVFVHKSLMCMKLSKEGLHTHLIKVFSGIKHSATRHCMLKCIEYHALLLHNWRAGASQPSRLNCAIVITVSIRRCYVLSISHHASRKPWAC